MFRTLLKEYVLHIINEGKIEEFEKKVPEDRKALYNRVFSIEPKLHPKFAPWVAKMYKTEEKPIDPFIVHKDLAEFDMLSASGYTEHKDVYAYPTFLSLDQDLNDAVEKRAKSLQDREIKKMEYVKASKEGKQAEKESKKVYEDARWLVVQPQTELASNYYGQSYRSCPTKWCISATDSKNHFNEYYEKGANFVFVIDKTAKPENTFSKLAIAYIDQNKVINQSNMSDVIEAYSADDVKLTMKQIYTYYPAKLIEKINIFLQADLIPKSAEDEINRIKSLPPATFAAKLDTYIEIINDQVATLVDKFKSDGEDEGENYEDMLDDSGNEADAAAREMLKLATPEQLFACAYNIFDHDEELPDFFNAYYQKMAPLINTVDDLFNFEKCAYKPEHGRMKQPNGFVSKMVSSARFNVLIRKILDQVPKDQELAIMDKFDAAFPGNNLATWDIKYKANRRMRSLLGQVAWDGELIDPRAIRDVQFILTQTDSWKNIPMDKESEAYKQIEQVSTYKYGNNLKAILGSGNPSDPDFRWTGAGGKLQKFVELIQTRRVSVKNGITYCT